MRHVLARTAARRAAGHRGARPARVPAAATGPYGPGDGRGRAAPCAGHHHRLPDRTGRTQIRLYRPEAGHHREAISAARDFIKTHLNPYPVMEPADFQTWGGPSRAQYVAPDVVIKLEEGEFVVEVIESRRFFMRINPMYSRLATQAARHRRALLRRREAPHPAICRAGQAVHVEHQPAPRDDAARSPSVLVRGAGRLPAPRRAPACAPDPRPGGRGAPACTSPPSAGPRRAST